MSQKKKNKVARKKIIAVFLAVTVVISIAAFTLMRAHWARKDALAAAGGDAVKVMPLQRTTLVDSISSSGIIYSDNTQNVYTTLEYPIKEIYVEVGDVVKAGDLLAVLDLSGLEFDIKQAETNLSNAEVSEVDTKLSNQNSVTNAQNSLESSKINLEKQQLNYDELKEQLENNSSTELINSKNSIDSAKTKLDTAKRELELKTTDYENNSILYNGGTISKSEFDSSKQAFDNAASEYNTALRDYENESDNYKRIQENLRKDLITAEKDLETAKISYQTSQNSLEQARQKAGLTQSSVENQKLSLEKLKNEQSEGQIIAAIDGTVTEVNAIIGKKGSSNSSSGDILFVIEDMNRLYVSTNVKEFRIKDIQIGQKAYVTTDATGDKVFSGEIKFISPKSSESSASSTTNVEFETHILLDESDPNIRIGMNAYANIILTSKENIYAVPLDAIAYREDGQAVIYNVKDGIAVEVPVTVGIENATSAEIEGAELSDGMSVIMTASVAIPGQPVKTEDAAFVRTKIINGGGKNGQGAAGSNERQEQTGGNMPTSNDFQGRAAQQNGEGLKGQGENLPVTESKEQQKPESEFRGD